MTSALVWRLAAACYHVITYMFSHHQVEDVAHYLQLEEQQKHLKYLLSEDSLILLPEYEQRINVSQ